jgi:hypothetical protein
MWTVKLFPYSCEFDWMFIATAPPTSISNWAVMPSKEEDNALSKELISCHS